jgi:hypothetical protein
MWFMYLDILCSFILGKDSKLTDALTVNARDGDFNYVNSLPLHLQKMNALPTEHPGVYKCFLKGVNGVRRDQD